MIFVWVEKKKRAKNDWTPFLKDSQPADFFADFIVGLLTIASLEYGITRVATADLMRAFLRLEEEFSLSKVFPVDDSCGYPYPSSVAKLFPMVFERGVEKIGDFHMGVPNRLVQENLQRLNKRGRDFIKALYPVADQFAKLVS